MTNDLNLPATKGDREQAERALEAMIGLVAELNLAFGGQNSQAAQRPIAATQLRYFFAMRAIGTFLKEIGQAHLQHRFFELAEALHGLSIGHSFPLLEMEESVKPRRGSRVDRPDIWRLRAGLCVGIRWVIKGGQTREETIRKTVRKHRRQLSKIERPGTKDLGKAIDAWLTRFENPTETDDTVAVALFKDGVAQLAALSRDFANAALKDWGEKLIAGAALHASELLEKS
jgi:hypothetical protein